MNFVEAEKRVPETYEASRTCAQCGFETVKALSKREAAFFCSLVEDFRCVECGSDEFSSRHWGMPVMDADLLSQWLEDETLLLMDQDEEIILAATPVGLLIEGFDQTGSAFRGKQIGIALAVKRYEDQFEKQKDREICEAWLLENVPVWKNDNFGYEYVSRDICERLKIQ